MFKWFRLRQLMRRTGSSKKHVRLTGYESHDVHDARDLLSVFSDQKSEVNSLSIDYGCLQKQPFWLDVEPAEVALSKALRNILSTTHKIKKLNLEVSDIGLAALAETMEGLKANCSVKTLVLENIGLDALPLLTEFTQQNQTLECLKVRLSNKTGPASISAQLTDFLDKVYAHPTITYFGIASDKNLFNKRYEFSEQELQKLAYLLEHKKSLTGFLLDHTDPRSPSISSVLQSLKGNTTLKNLTIRLGTNQIEHLIELVEANSSLDTITVVTDNRNEFWEAVPEGFSKFLDALKKNSSLRHVTIPSLNTADAHLKLCEVLRANSMLQTLHLNRFENISNSGFYSSLNEALKFNTTICNIFCYLSGYSIFNKPIRLNIDDSTIPSLKLKLLRNQYLRQIKSNPKELEKVLKDADINALDTRFFAALIQEVPEALYAKNSELISYLMRKRKATTFTGKLSFYLRLNQNLHGITEVLELLSQEAEQGNVKSQIALGHIYSKGLLEQPIDEITINKAAHFFSLAATSNTQAAYEAHFELGQLHMLNDRDHSIAIEHFDIVASANCAPLREMAIALRKRCLDALVGKSGLDYSNATETDYLKEFKDEKEAFNDPEKFLSQFAADIIETHKTGQQGSSLIYRTFRWNEAKKVIEVAEKREKLASAAEARCKL